MRQLWSCLVSLRSFVLSRLVPPVAPLVAIGWIFEGILGAEPSVPRERGQALLEGIEAAIGSASTAAPAVLGTPWSGLRSIRQQR